MIDYLVQRAGVFAKLAGAFSIASFITLMVLFAGVAIFGPLNDLLSIVQFLLMLPVALALHKVFQAKRAGLSLLAAAIAVIGIFSFVATQTMLLLGRIPIEQSIVGALTSYAVVGAGWLIFGLLMLSDVKFPSLLAWVSILVGAASVFGTIGFFVGGQQHPLTILSILFNAIALPIWAFWLGRLFSSGKLPVGIAR